jgi:hypothetical protein
MNHRVFFAFLGIGFFSILALSAVESQPTTKPGLTTTEELIAFHSGSGLPRNNLSKQQTTTSEVGVMLPGSENLYAAATPGANSGSMLYAAQNEMIRTAIAMQTPSPANEKLPLDLELKQQKIGSSVTLCWKKPTNVFTLKKFADGDDLYIDAVSSVVIITRYGRC